MKTMVIDWKLRRSYGVRRYIKRRIVDKAEEIHYVNAKRVAVEYVTFRNFPRLHIECNQMIQCKFEDCGEIYLTSDCGHGNCRFQNIKRLHCTGDFLKHCEFENIRCTGTALVELYKCRMSGCAFRNVYLTKDTLLVCGHGSSYVSGCRLDKVTTERKDDELFYRDEWHMEPFVDEKTKMAIAEVNQIKSDPLL